MRELLRGCSAYRRIAADVANGCAAQTMLVLFPDGKFLRPLLRECAKAFFGAAEGGRTAELIEKERYADCLFFPAEGAKLTAEEGTRILDESLLRPVEGDKKLFVLDAFSSVTPLVQNKLLKVLEEPPQGTWFLLGAETEFSVLPTVLSRAKKFVVPPFSEEEIARALLRAHPGAETKAAAAASGGIYSLAESLLSGGGEAFRLAEAFLSGKEPEAFCRRNADYEDKRGFFAALTLLLRELLFLRTGQERYAALGGESLRVLAAEYPAGAVIAALERTREAEKQIRFNANFGQCLYSLAIGIGEDCIKWQRLS